MTIPVALNYYTEKCQYYNQLDLNRKGLAVWGQCCQTILCHIHSRTCNVTAVAYKESRTRLPFSCSFTSNKTSNVYKVYIIFKRTVQGIHVRLIKVNNVTWGLKET